MYGIVGLRVEFIKDFSCLYRFIGVFNVLQQFLFAVIFHFLF